MRAVSPISRAKLPPTPAPAHDRRLPTRAVARLVSISPARVRAMARSGLCHPQKQRGRYQFSFQDVVLLRAAVGLLQSKVSGRGVWQALRRLRQQLPDGRPLTGVRITAGADGVVARESGTIWHPASGQVLFSFLVDDLARAAKVIAVASPIRRRRQPRAPLVTGESWFERALVLEQEGDLDGAREAYERAVTLDPDLADGYVNLGRLLHQAGDAVRAADLYLKAIAADPEDPVAHYNLALACEDQEHWNESVVHYRSAIEASPDFADAHFNLGRLLDRMGHSDEAAQHMRTYKALLRDS